MFFKYFVSQKTSSRNWQLLFSMAGTFHFWLGALHHTKYWNHYMYIFTST